MSYKELFESLNEYGVIYVIIGGYAVNYYGYSRMTEDLDLLFQPTTQNGKRLLSALQEIGFDITQYSYHDFSKQTHFRLGDPPNTVDVINNTKGLDLKTVFKNSIKITINNIPVPLISLDDLISNKKALNTFKDLADAEMLLKIKNKKK